jgi:hypothetical protein
MNTDHRAVLLEEGGGETGVGVTLELDDLLQFGATNRNGAYRFFLIHFLPCVVGRIRHRLNAHSVFTSDLCTVSTEAFALVVLENNWEYWKAKLKAKTEGVDMPLDAQLQKYTNRPAGGERRERDGQVGSGGWSVDGVLRFVELTRLVERDRRDERRMKLEKEVMEYQDDQLATTTRKGRKRSRTQIQNPESRRDERARWEALMDVSARQDFEQPLS